MSGIDGPEPVMVRVRGREISKATVASFGGDVGRSAERREDGFDSVSIDEIHESVLQATAHGGRMSVRSRTNTVGRWDREDVVRGGSRRRGGSGDVSRIG